MPKPTPAEDLTRIAMDLLMIARRLPGADKMLQIRGTLTQCIRDTIQECDLQVFHYGELEKLLLARYPNQKQRIRNLGSRLVNMVESGELVRDDKAKTWRVVEINDPAIPRHEMKYRKMRSGLKPQTQKET